MIKPGDKVRATKQMVQYGPFWEEGKTYIVKTTSKKCSRWKLNACENISSLCLTQGQRLTFEGNSYDWCAGDTYFTEVKKTKPKKARTRMEDLIL